MQDLFENTSENKSGQDWQKIQKRFYLAKPCSIQEIQCDTEFTVTTGIVISKCETRETSSRSYKDKLDTGNLCVFSFTLRDSRVDFINVSVWGSRDFVERIAKNVQVQSGVRVRNAAVKLKKDIDDRFNPWTTSQYHLSVSEGSATVDPLTGDEHCQFQQLATTPIREHNDYYTLEDIIASHENVIDNDVNLLFAIREIGEPIEVRNAKTGKKYLKQDLVVFDQTRDAFKITLWDCEVIKFASTWKKLIHVVFAIDLTISYNSYEKSLCASSSSRSVFTVNPCTKEGFALYSYAKNAKLSPIVPILEQFKSQAIKCTIEELRNLFCQDMLNSEFVLLNAVISEFNIDSDFSRCFSIRCKSCYSRLDQNIRRCYNRDCYQQGDSINNYSRHFDSTVSVSDYTSTLTNVAVGAKLFEKLFGFSLDTDYEKVSALTPEEITNLKWKVLLEKWSILIKITTKTIEEENQDSIKYYFRIINLDRIDQE